MAYLLTHFWRAQPWIRYKASIAAVHTSGGLPEGQTYHAAGPTDGGILIAAVWESKSNPTASSKTSCCRACPSRGALRAAGGARGRDREPRHTPIEPAWR